MNVKVTGSTAPLSICDWWYAKHIGEEFEVEPDPKTEGHLITYLDYKGKQEAHHILEKDCIVIES